MNKLKLASLLALAGSGLVSSAHAITYTPGDLLIGFRSTSNTSENYVIDIGQASLYDQQNGATFVVDPADAAGNASNLSTVFGTPFDSGNHTLWGVVGFATATDVPSTLYAGKKETTFGTFPVSTASGNYARDLSGNQQSTGSVINTVGLDLANYSAAPGTTHSVIEQTSDSSSWSGLGVQDPNNPGLAFQQWTASSFEGTINASTTAGHALDLFQAIPNDLGTGGSPTYEGRFVIDNTGAITFTSAVPEPSTLTALAGGLGLLCFLRRRRAVTA